MTVNIVNFNFKVKPKKAFMIVNISDNIDDLVQKLSEKFYALAKVNIGENKSFHVALPGGNTPVKFFNYLTEFYANKIDWNLVHFYWGDERCVPPYSSESNFRMAQLALIDKINILPQNIHRIMGENNPEVEAERYAMEIRKFITADNSLPRFDLIILGMGEDGHTASLFPDQLSLLQSDKICIVTRHPVSGQYRISLTLKAINQAQNVIFLVTGKNKAEKIKSIIKNSKESINFPASYAKPASGNLFWFIDKEAATKLVN
jgi:6-phosphogluconolactonase